MPSLSRTKDSSGFRHDCPPSSDPPEPISTVHPKFQDHFDKLKAVITEDPSSCTVLNYNLLVKLATAVKEAIPSRSLKANLDKVDEAQKQ